MVNKDEEFENVNMDLVDRNLYFAITFLNIQYFSYPI